MASAVMIERRDEAIIGRIVDRDVIDAGRIERIKSELHSICETTETPHIVLSFRNVEHMSSAAISMLVTLHRDIASRGGKLALSGISKDLMQMFKITRLDKLLKIYDTSGTAIAEMK